MAIGGKGRMKGRSYRGKRACVRFCKCPHIPPPHPHPNAMFDGGSGRGGGFVLIASSYEREISDRRLDKR